MAAMSPYMGNASYVFVSYSRYDAYRAEPIIERMIADGYRVFYQDGVEPGCDWDDATVSRIENCSCALFMISSAHLNATGCIDAVINVSRDKPRLPVMLEWVTLPAELQGLSALDHYVYIDQDAFFAELYRWEALATCLVPCMHNSDLCQTEPEVMTETAEKVTPSAAEQPKKAPKPVPAQGEIPPAGERWVDRDGSNATPRGFGRPVPPPRDPYPMMGHRLNRLFLIPAVPLYFISLFLFFMIFSAEWFFFLFLMFAAPAALLTVFAFVDRWPVVCFYGRIKLKRKTLCWICLVVVILSFLLLGASVPAE